MDVKGIKDISPFVRMMRIKKAMAMSGKWRDIDNVFTYIAQGSAEFIVNGNKYVCGVGDSIIIPPFKTHIVRSLGSEPLVQYIFHFDFYERPESQLLEHHDVLDTGIDIEVPEKEKIIGDQVFVATLSEKERIEIKKMYLNMYKEFFSEGKESLGIMLKAYATVILVTTLRNGLWDEAVKDSEDKTKITKSWVHIENAIAYINSHYMDEMDNDAISNAIGVTPNYLTNVFRNYLGISLHKYIINVKIEKAQQILNLGLKNVTEAAEEAGFPSIHAFSKTFKSVVGMTPSEYLNYVAPRETMYPNNHPKNHDIESME